MAFYQALKATGSPILKAAYHPWIRGKENIPAEGPAILASNHNAVWDSVFLPMMLDREVVFMGKADYFTGTGFKGWMTKEFMRAVGTIPVDRGRGHAELVARIEIGGRHLAARHDPDLVRVRGRQLVESGGGPSKDEGGAPAGGVHASHEARVVFIGRSDRAGPDLGGVRQRAENVEGRREAEGAAHGRGETHRGMHLVGEEEGDAHLIEDAA